MAKSRASLGWRQYQDNERKDGFNCPVCRRVVRVDPKRNIWVHKNDGTRACEQLKNVFVKELA